MSDSGPLAQKKQVPTATRMVWLTCAGRSAAEFLIAKSDWGNEGFLVDSQGIVKPCLPLAPKVNRWIRVSGLPKLERPLPAWALSWKFQDTKKWGQSKPYQMQCIGICELSSTCTAVSCLSEEETVSPWLGGSAGWRIVLYTKKVAGSIPGRGAYGRQPIDVSLLQRCFSLFLTPFLSLSKN